MPSKTERLAADPANCVDLWGLQCLTGSDSNDSRWTDNGDGSYTAKTGATLWGLQHETGKDWRDTDYSGNPEELQVGQTVRFKTNAEKLDQFVSVSGDLTGAISSGVKNFGKSWYTTSQVPNQFSYPIKTLPDYELLQTSNNLQTVSNILLVAGIGLDLYDGIKTGIEDESFLHGVYRTVANLASTGAGYVVGSFVTTTLTVSTFGAGAIPGVIVGTAAGTATSMAVSEVFSKLEDIIWEE